MHLFGIIQKKFKPGITHRRLFDKQVKTPGKVKPNVTGMEWLKREDMEPVGHQEVHLKHIASEQPTVSAHHVKRKIDEITAGKKQAPAKLLLHNGVYHVLDGNHGITAHRALGHATVHADVWKLKDTTKKSR